MRIGDREIGPGNPVFICCELGPNHAGSLDLAKRLIRAAKEAGADAVKVQLYEPACLTMQSDHPAYNLTEGPWAGRTLWDLYSEGQTPFAWLPELVAEAERVGVLWFASVFSERGLAACEDAGCPAYKIASSEVLDLGLVRAVAVTGKPVILSDGMANELEMATAWKFVTAEQGTGIGAVELHCVSDYPADPAAYALGDKVTAAYAWGISDHTPVNELAVAAVALGACMVEKHLMLDSLDYDRWPLDRDHSLTPSQFAEYVRAIRTTEAMLANTERKLSGSQWRRRLVFARDLPAGHVLTREDVAVKRCGQGAEPESQIEGARLACDVSVGVPVVPGTLEWVQSAANQLWADAQRKLADLP